MATRIRLLSSLGKGHLPNPPGKEAIRERTRRALSTRGRRIPDCEPAISARAGDWRPEYHYPTFLPSRAICGRCFPTGFSPYHTFWETVSSGLECLAAPPRLLYRAGAGVTTTLGRVSSGAIRRDRPCSSAHRYGWHRQDANSSRVRVSLSRALPSRALGSGRYPGKATHGPTNQRQLPPPSPGTPAGARAPTAHHTGVVQDADTLVADR